MKKKVLFVGEASFLKTGYSTYHLEIMSRLAATNKYELAELGCFADRNAPEQHQLPWKFFGNLPNKDNPDEVNLYNAQEVNSFGAWKFEETLLQFPADVVIDIRDEWMCNFETKSPFRKNYHLILMPTVDATPQNPQWLYTFMQADSVLNYSDWGKAVLDKAGGLIKTVGTASPGTDLKTFVPAQNKAKHRQSWGIANDAFIIGTVMRNQTRKLYPDLIKTFAEFLKQAPKELAERSYLYMHTSYPDWWDLPALIIEHEVSHRCLFTYKCKTCNMVAASLFQDGRAACQRCQRNDAMLPNTHFGIERHEVAQIYNLFDVYVQYSNSEGFGIPIVEAASCGIPVFCVDYSAMSDVVRKLRGYPIAVSSMTKEPNSGCERALPSSQDLIDKLLKHAQLPETWRNKKGFEARKGVENYYDWNKTAKVWENLIDSVPTKDKSVTWTSPADIHTPVRDVPAYLEGEQFVQWALINVAGRPDLCNSYIAMRLIRDLQWGSTVESTVDRLDSELSSQGVRDRRKNFGKEDILRLLKALCDHRNFWETQRVERLVSH
jgi:glycosyltransferase involved in cell wall biosynthesis